MTSAREKFQGVWTQIRSMTVMEDERYGAVRIPAAVARFDGERASPARLAPQLGEDTEAALAALGPVS